MAVGSHRLRFRWRPVRRVAVLAGALAVAATPVRAMPDWQALEAFSLDGLDAVALYAALLVLVAMATWLLRDVVRTTDRRPDLRDLDDVELAYCLGGNKRAADTLYLALASRGAARLERAAVVVDGPIPGLPPRLNAMSLALAGTHPRRRFHSAFAGSPPTAAMRQRLLARKILLDQPRSTRLALATRVPLGVLLLFGLLEVGIGASHDQAVGPLVFVMAISTSSFVALFGRERCLTREAIASLDALRASRSRTLRAPSPDDLALAFALSGTVALEGTAFAGYLKPASGHADRRPVR